MDKKTKRKNEILEASMKVMYLKGYNGTGVKDLTHAAGIPKGSFYNYFEGKEAYAIEALQYYEAMGDREFSILRDQKVKPLERIINFYTMKIKNIHQEKLSYGCFLGNLSEEVGGVNPMIAQAADEFHQRIEALICRNLEEARKQGAYKGLLDDQAMARFIASAWQGTLLRSKVSKNRQCLEGFLLVLVEGLLK